MTTRHILFERFIPFILKHEGGYVDDPDDRGGATNMGITQRTLDSYQARRGESSFPVARLTQEQAKQIYYDDYFLPVGLALLPNNVVDVAFKVFDLGINMGPSRAVRLLQEAVVSTGIAPLTADGKLGQRTADAVGLAYTKGLYQNYKFFAAHHYLTLCNDPSQRKFLRGWFNRLRFDLPPAAFVGV